MSHRALRMYCAGIDTVPFLAQWLHSMVIVAAFTEPWGYQQCAGGLLFGEASRLSLAFGRISSTSVLAIRKCRPAEDRKSGPIMPQQDKGPLMGRAGLTSSCALLAKSRDALAVYICMFIAGGLACRMPPHVL